jgi:carboxyl-terminal processing protease
MDSIQKKAAPMKTRTTLSLSLLFALAVACGHEDPSHAPAPPPSTPATTAASPAADKASPSVAHDDEAPALPREKFTDGERAFRTIKETLAAHYYTTGLSEDDLYRAAAEGMLERIDPKMHKWNKLLSPSELAEMDADMKGEIVGIGIMINFDSTSGYTDVLGTIPNSPGERAHLVAGDKIISVDGKLYKGKQLRDVIGDIRGKKGDVVTLTVLRDDKLLTVPVKREVVPIEPVSGMTLPGDVAYVRIGAFNGKTTASLKDLLATMTSAKAIVVDLRCSPGGLFEEAVAAAGFFFAAGTPIVQLERRGEPVETITSKGDRLVGDIPMVVLVDGDTSSGGEFVAAALAEQRGARLVGTHSYGKWSVQKLDKLPNGYAMKYTTSLFHAPSGKSYDGVGLTPDVEVAMDDKAVERAVTVKDPTKRLADDVQLRTAVQLLRKP